MHRTLDERFGEAVLNPERWMANHLPHWSTPASSGARYHFDDDGLVLRIDEDQPEWCPDLDPGVRVSALQSGHFAGPLGSGVGQHRFTSRLKVRTDWPARALLVPHFCRITMTARARMNQHQLVSLYLIGFERDHPEDSGEITLMEVFGAQTGIAQSTVNVGVKRINDPRLRDEIHPVTLPIDLVDWHDYAMTWSPTGVTFAIDGETVATTSQSPRYAMQLMLTMYDLSGKQSGADLRPGSFHVRRLTIEPVAS